MLLELNNLKDRAYKLLSILNREFQFATLKANIQMKTREELDRQQREYFLQQEMRNIQEELGEAGNNDIENFYSRSLEKDWSAEVGIAFKKEIDKLKHMYEEALSVEDVIGIVIGTRPDCVSDELLDYLGHLNTQTFITIEYGIETANNNTLKLINRGHDFECVKRIVSKTAEKGIITGGHIILGLPGEDSEEIIRQAPLISALPINILKLHQLQVIHGTKLEQMYKEHPFHLFSPDEYIELIGRYIKLLRKDIVIERFTSQSPKDMLVGPQWGMKNHEFTDKLMKYLRENNIYQGQNVILP